MLDRNFTELDNDFITLWSQILLRKDFKYGETITPKGFIQLVELGQMDAMQYYPWFYNYDSRILSDDAHTNGLLPIGGSNLNLLKLNMMRRQRHNHHKFNARPPHSLLTLLAQEINTLMGLMYDYMSCSNLIALESYYEIKARHRIFRSCKNREFRGQLEAQYTNDPNNPVYAFVYARHLHNFGNKNDKSIAHNILKELSERKLSNILLDKIEQDKQEWREHENIVRAQYCTPLRPLGSNGLME